MKRDLRLEELVIEEAIKLKKYATKKELAKLDYNTLNGGNTTKCVYGQMTDHCESLRAGVLIEKCCNIVFNVTRRGITNTKKLKDIDVPYVNRLSTYFSPIEKLLMKYKKNSNINSNKIKKLVAFLKDETKTLEL